MRKILSLLLILALFLPCALAETPQGIDLALTSTYGDGLSLRMTAGLGETKVTGIQKKKLLLILQGE